MYGFILFFALNTLFYEVRAFNCPSAENVVPCSCDNSSATIECHADFSVESFLEKLNVVSSDKNYERSLIKEGNPRHCGPQLGPNAFKELKFKRVKLVCSDLKSIDKFAFISMANKLEEIHIEYSPLTNDLATQREIFDVANTLSNLRVFLIARNNLRFLPDSAFRNRLGQPSQITELWLHRNQISVVGHYAFENLHSLAYVSLYKNPIKQIKSFAFDLPESETNLVIDLSFEDSDTENSAFTPLSLAGIKRSALLQLGSSKLTTLNRDAFTLFFEEHPKHVVQWKAYSNLTCDCDMFWLRKDAFEPMMYKDRFSGERLLCKGSGKEIWDLQKEAFGNCNITDTSETIA